MKLLTALFAMLLLTAFSTGAAETRNAARQPGGSAMNLTIN